MADARILELALIGLQAEREKVDDEIARIQWQLGRDEGRGVAKSAGAGIWKRLREEKQAMQEQLKMGTKAA